VSRRALGILLAIASSSCADAPRPGPPPHSAGGAGCAGEDCLSPPTGCAEPAPGCPCAAEGDHLVCGQVESQVASQTVCGMGYSVCEAGIWAPCLINNTAPIEPPAAPGPPGGVQPYSLGKPTKCAANPCDPSCWDFVDTPIGEDDPDAGLAASSDGITLVPGGPPPAVYLAADFARDYDAVGLCDPGSTPLWGLWSWNVKAPPGTFITFSVQTAATAAGLAVAPVDALQFSSPPGPSALAGQVVKAQLGPPDTTAGSAVVDATLVSRGRVRGLPFLRIIAHLAPSSDGQEAPLLSAWDLQVSCAPSE
jgi:hypothetical protein